ncbi:unnamed protein product [Sphagnum troendelagicum]
MTLKLAYTRVVRVCIVTSHDGWSLHRNFNLAAERMALEERTRQLFLYNINPCTCEEKVREELNELPEVQTIVCDQSNHKVTVSGHVDPILALDQVKKVKKKSDFFPVDSYISNVVSQTAPTTYTSQGYVHRSSDGAGAGLTRSNSFGRHLGRLPSFGKVTSYEAPPQEYELHAKVREYEAPRKEYEHRDHETPRKEYERRDHEAPQKEYERRDHEAPRKE